MTTLKNLMDTIDNTYRVEVDNRNERERLYKIAQPMVLEFLRKYNFLTKKFIISISSVYQKFNFSLIRDLTTEEQHLFEKYFTSSFTMYYYKINNISITIGNHIEFAFETYSQMFSFINKNKIKCVLPKEFNKLSKAISENYNELRILEKYLLMLAQDKLLVDRSD